MLSKARIVEIASTHGVPPAFLRDSLSRTQLIVSALNFFKRLSGYAIVGGRDAEAADWISKRDALATELGVAVKDYELNTVRTKA